MIEENISFRISVLDNFIEIAEQSIYKEPIDKMILKWLKELRSKNKTIMRTSAINKVIVKINTVKEYAELTFNQLLVKRCNQYIELLKNIFDHVTNVKKIRILTTFFTNGKLEEIK